ncbi:PRTase-like protein [Thozetella sp. PMI_491]|nr:PRTase-like protein [Thozetella sp. PMI_491]
MDASGLDLILSRMVMYRDHPKPGHRFADIFPIFRSPAATKVLLAGFVEHIKATHDLKAIHAIVCLEARGMFFAPLVASALNLPCIPVRKEGKLPGAVVSVSYEKDYGHDTLQMKDDSFEGVGEGRQEGTKVRVLLIDDLVALGGSAQAGKRLVGMLGGEVAECLFIFDVPRFTELVKEKLGGTPSWSLISLTENILSKVK